jgi:hypothetical protein
MRLSKRESSWLLQIIERESLFSSPPASMSFSRRLISATAHTGSGRVLSARCLSLTPSRLNTSNEADPIKPIYTPLAKPAAVDGVVLSQTNRPYPLVR